MVMKMGLLIASTSFGVVTCKGRRTLEDAYSWRRRRIVSAMTRAFLSSVSMAPIALAATLSTPFSEIHLVTSSRAAARACWLCRSSVRASAVAMLASELSDMEIVHV